MNNGFLPYKKKLDGQRTKLPSAIFRGQKKSIRENFAAIFAQEAKSGPSSAVAAFLDYVNVCSISFFNNDFTKYKTDKLVRLVRLALAMDLLIYVQNI